MTDSVVVPAVDVPSSFVCLRSLHERGVHTIAVSERENPEVFCSRYADERFRVPHPEKDVRRYKDALLRLAERGDVRTIVPVREEDVYVLSRYRKAFDARLGTPWPEFETLRRVHDRIELYDTAETAGVPVPETHLLTECDDWSRRWIVKGRYALLAEPYLDRSSEVATDENDEVFADGDAELSERGRIEGIRDPPTTEYLPAGRRPNVEELCAEFGHVPLVQEFLPGSDEYAFFALYDEGEALSTFQHRQIRGFTYGGGPSAFRKSVDIPDLEEYGTRLLDQLDWHGPAMVEFKRDESTGEFELMEVNPRFWSSLPFSVRAGADFPFYYWSLANGRRDRIERSYEVGVGGHLLMGEVRYLYSVLAREIPLVERPPFFDAVATVLASLVRHPRFDYLDVSDPCPGLRYAYDTLKRV